MPELASCGRLPIASPCLARSKLLDRSGEPNADGESLEPAGESHALSSDDAADPLCATPPCEKRRPGMFLGTLLLCGPADPSGEIPPGLHAEELAAFQLCRDGRRMGMPTPLDAACGRSSSVAPSATPYMLSGPSLSSLPP